MVGVGEGARQTPGQALADGAFAGPIRPISATVRFGPGRGALEAAVPAVAPSFIANRLAGRRSPMRQAIVAPGSRAAAKIEYRGRGR